MRHAYAERKRVSSSSVVVDKGRRVSRATAAAATAAVAVATTVYTRARACVCILCMRVERSRVARRVPGYPRFGPPEVVYTNADRTHKYTIRLHVPIYHMNAHCTYFVRTEWYNNIKHKHIKYILIIYTGTYL